MEDASFTESFKGSAVWMVRGYACGVLSAEFGVARQIVEDTRDVCSGWSVAVHMGVVR